MYIFTLTFDYNEVIINPYCVASHENRLYVTDVYHRNKEFQKN